MNFWRKIIWKVDFLTEILTVNVEFWRKNEIKSWFLEGKFGRKFWILSFDGKLCEKLIFLQDFDRKYWILTEKWNEKLLFDGIFDRKYWILTFKWNEKLIYWQIWVWSVSFKKRNFRQFSSQIQLEKLISILRQKSFNPGLLLTFVLWHRSFDFINELRNWLSALPDYVSSFSPFAK